MKAVMPTERLGIKFYNLKEAADVLGVSYATVKNYRAAGRISGQRIGRSILVPEEELLRLLTGARTVANDSK